MLKWVERSPEQLKVGFESYLTQQTGYPADIGRLDHARFFPSMVLDMSDVRFWAIDNPDRTMIALGRAQVRMPLWSVMIGAPRFSMLAIEDVSIDAAVTGIAPITVDSIALDDALPAIKLRGVMEETHVTFDLPVARAGMAYKPQRPPLRLTGSIEGPRTKGDIFVDVNTEEYGATASFARYAARDVRPIQGLLTGWLMGRMEEGETLPIHLHIEALEGTPGPFVVPALRVQNGALQPLECFYNNQGRAQANPHPCAAYFDEPDTDDTP